MRTPIAPMLSRPSAPFDSDTHSFELKWDGTRCIAFIGGGHGPPRAGRHSPPVILQNRRLADITHRYPEFETLHRGLGAKSAVLDGEIVVLERGRPDFRRLQQREHLLDTMKIKMRAALIPATYVVFDLLYLDGRALFKRPLTERRELLRGLMPLSDNVVFSESYSRGRALFREAVRRGFEGVMAKEKTSPYLPGKRTSHWLKIKKSFDVDAVVSGYTEGEGSRSAYFGSLVLGLYDRGNLIYIGRVGTGLDEATMARLLKTLRALRTKHCPFVPPPHIERKVQWVRPEVVVRAGYHEWTKEGLMRFPVFKGIREDKDPKECIKGL